MIKSAMHGKATVRWLAACLVSWVGYSTYSFGDCPTPLPPPGFSDDVREFYTDMCRESDAPLVLASDPNMKSRLQMPSGGRRVTEEEIYPDKARRLGFEGSVVVAATVELDGSVHRAKIIQSSGHRSLDDAEWTYWKQYKFDTPGQIDGKPVRTIILERMKFELKGGPGLPPSFSDWVVENLALRIIQPYNSRDVNSLFQAIDQTAQGNITVSKIQERFTRYTKQFGGMRYFEYKGVVGLKNVGGVPHYELAYLISTAIPPAGTAVLTVTAVDHPPLPGIIDFYFKPSPIRLSFH